MTYISPETANLKLGDPYPGMPGYIVGGSLAYGITPVKEYTSPVPNADAPGGANNPIPYSEAIRIYGTDAGVNVSGPATTPYVEGHDSKEIPTTAYDLAQDLRNPATANLPQVQQFVKENPGVAAQAQTIADSYKPVEVPVSNPKAVGLAEGSTYETTTETGQKITLKGNASGEVSLEGTKTAIDSSESRLKDLGLKVAPSVQNTTPATPTKENQRALANELAGKGLNPVASAVGGGILALPGGYIGIEKYSGTALERFTQASKTAEAKLAFAGMTPVATSAKGGAVGYSQGVGLYPTANAPTKTEDSFSTTTAFLKQAEDFAAWSVEGGFEKDSTLDKIANAGARFAVGLPASVLATVPFTYDLLRVEKGGTQEQLIQKYQAEGYSPSAAYLRSTVDTKGTQAFTTGALIALSMAPEFKIGEAIVTAGTPALGFASILVAKNVLDQPADKQLNTLAFDAGGLVAFKVISDYASAQARKNIQVSSESKVVQLGETQPAEFLGVETLQRKGFVSTKSTATNIFGSSVPEESLSRFQAGSIEGGRTAVSTAGMANGEAIASVGRLEPFDPAFTKVSYSTPGSTANPIFIEKPSVSLGRGGGSFSLEQGAFPQGVNPNTVPFASTTEVFYSRGSGVVKSYPVLGPVTNKFFVGPNRFASEFQFVGLPQSEPALPYAIQKGLTFSTTTGTVSPESAAIIRGTAKVRLDLTTPGQIAYDLPDAYTLKVNGKFAAPGLEYFNAEPSGASFSTKSPAFNPPKSALPLDIQTPTYSAHSPLYTDTLSTPYDQAFMATAKRLTPTGGRTTVVDSTFGTSFPNYAPPRQEPLFVGVLSPTKATLTADITPFVAVEKGVTTRGVSFTSKTSARYYAPTGDAIPEVGSGIEGLPDGDVLFGTIQSLKNRSPLKFDEVGTSGPQVMKVISDLASSKSERALPAELTPIVVADSGATAALAAERSASVASSIARSLSAAIYAPSISESAVPTTGVIQLPKTSTATQPVLKLVQAEGTTQTFQPPVVSQMPFAQAETKNILDTRTILDSGTTLVDAQSKLLTQPFAQAQAQTTRQTFSSVPENPQPGIAPIQFPLPPVPDPFPIGGGGEWVNLPFGGPSGMPSAPAFAGRRGFRYAPSLIAIGNDIRVTVPKGRKSVRLPETGNVFIRPIIEFEGADKKRKPAALKSLSDVGPRKLGPSIGDQIKTYVVKFGGRKK